MTKGRMGQPPKGEEDLRDKEGGSRLQRGSLGAGSLTCCVKSDLFHDAGSPLSKLFEAHPGNK